MKNLFDIRGKKAIVTGGSRGIGKGIAKGLHDAGVELVVMGTNDKVLASAEEISTPGTKAYGVICDFNGTGDIEGAFQKAMEFLGGGIDILINNAGTQIRHKCEEFPLEDWEKVLAETDLLYEHFPSLLDPLFFRSRALAPPLDEGPGRPTDRQEPHETGSVGESGQAVQGLRNDVSGENLARLGSDSPTIGADLSPMHEAGPS